MGILRLLLALAVVSNHSAPFFGLTMTQGRLSVQLFYIISGFYMSLVLNEKYPPGTYWLFMLNRYLRLFPLYIVVVAATIGASCLSGWLLHDWQRLEVWDTNFGILSIPAKAWLIFSNFFIWGLDGFNFFLQDRTGSFLCSARHSLDQIPGWKYILVPQAWTLGVELAFYSIAPFLVRRTLGYVAIVLTLSICLRMYLYKVLGWSFDPWTYRFFPCELALFLMGTVSYKIYLGIRNISWSKYVAVIGGTVFIVSCVFYPQVTAGTDSNYNVMVYWIAGMIIVPFLFNLTKGSKVDAYIGEYSYPIYLVHVVIGGGVAVILARIGIIQWLGELTVLLSIVASSLLIHLICDPIDAFRKKRLSRK